MGRKIEPRKRPQNSFNFLSVSKYLKQCSFFARSRKALNSKFKFEKYASKKPYHMGAAISHSAVRKKSSYSILHRTLHIHMDRLKNK